MIEIAAANLAYPGKNEDACLVRPLHGESLWLLAVADGLSMSGGRLAAQTVVRILEQVDAQDTARSVFEQLLSRLKCEVGEFPESETTVTCGLLRTFQKSGCHYANFDFFAIGDSPIWKVVRSAEGNRYPFQRYLVHGTPYPSETARVYSTVRLPQKDVKGPVSFGAIEISADEVLVICTDGIPEREVFFKDQNRQPPESVRAPGLCQWLFQKQSYDDLGISSVLNAYQQQGLLYDDATIIATRIRSAEMVIEPKDNLFADIGCDSTKCPDFRSEVETDLGSENGPLEDTTKIMCENNPATRNTMLHENTFELNQMILECDESMDCQTQSREPSTYNHNDKSNEQKENEVNRISSTNVRTTPKSSNSKDRRNRKRRKRHP